MGCLIFVTSGWKRLSRRQSQHRNLGISAVQKGLCIVALSIAVIVFALFLADLILGLAGMNEIAPFKCANMTIDIVFVVCSLTLAVMSWFTLREQV
jgi:hypothetical protein